MVEIKCDILECAFVEHINIIGSYDGLIYDSGTCKSFLFESLRDQQIQHKLKSNCNIRFVDSPYTLSGLQLNQSDCIVIDEANFAPEEIDQLLHAIRQVNAYFIVIGRLFVKQLEYSVDAIWQMRYTNDVFELSKAFDNVQSCDKYCNIIACEDSTPVASIYADILGEDVIPVRGRSNFYKYIKNEFVAFIIADKPKFGQELLNLIYRAMSGKSKTKYLVLFLPSCFEEIVCELGGIEKHANLDTSFDFEELAMKDCDWNKNNTVESVRSLRFNCDISKSLILSDLYKFYYGHNVNNCSRCYVVALEDQRFFDALCYKQGMTKIVS